MRGSRWSRVERALCVPSAVRASCRYSHRHMGDLGGGGNDVEEVRFFCNTSAHSRVMHFKTSNTHVRGVAFSGDHQGQNSASHWNIGWTALAGHTASLPASTNNRWQVAGFSEFPFYRNGAYHWSIRGNGYWWECDSDARSSAHTTRHQVWVRQRTSGPVGLPTEPADAGR